jgi:hypothetical protein
MTQDRRRRLDFLSPPVLVLASVALALVSALIPPGFYRATVHEPNLMFLNLPMLAFYIAMCAIFFSGYRLALMLKPFRLRLGVKAKIGLSLFLYVIIPVLLASLLMLYTTIALMVKIPDAVVLALAGQAQTTKVQLSEIHGIKGSLSGAVPFAMAIFWWSLWVWATSRAHFTRFRQRLVLLMALALGALIVSYATIIAARNILLPTLVGAAIIYMRYGTKEVSRPKQLLRVMALPLALLLLFNLFSMLRGYHGSKIAEMLVGYIPASFNHLAAQLDGRLDYSLPGIAYSNFDFMLHPPMLGRLVDIGKLLGLGRVPLNSAFADAINHAGLNGDFVWVTAFGYIYAQLGLLTPLYVLAWGFIVGRIWIAFVSSRLLGVIFYPWSAFSIIFFFGSNYFFSNYLSSLFLAFSGLWLYSQIVIVRPGRTTT